MGYGRKTILHNFLEIATYLSPSGYSQDKARWCVEEKEGSR